MARRQAGWMVLIAIGCLANCHLLQCGLPATSVLSSINQLQLLQKKNLLPSLFHLMSNPKPTSLQQTYQNPFTQTLLSVALHPTSYAIPLTLPANSVYFPSFLSIASSSSITQHFLCACVCTCACMWVDVCVKEYQCVIICIYLHVCGVGKYICFIQDLTIFSFSFQPKRLCLKLHDFFPVCIIQRAVSERSSIHLSKLKTKFRIIIIN